MPKSQAATTDRDYPEPPPSAAADDLEAYGLKSEAKCAKTLKRTIGTLRRWRKARKGPPFIVIERSVYYRDAAIADWLLKKEQSFDDDKVSTMTRRRNRGRKGC
jgi:hypothetical protein